MEMDICCCFLIIIQLQHFFITMFVAKKKNIAMSLLFPQVSCILTSSIKSVLLTKCERISLDGQTPSWQSLQTLFSLDHRAATSEHRCPNVNREKFCCKTRFKQGQTYYPCSFAHPLLFIYRMFIFQCSSIFVSLLNLESCISPVVASHIVHIPRSHCASLVPGSLSLVCVFSLKADVSLSSSLESSSPHQYVCALFIRAPPTTTEAAGTGSLNKTEQDGALWSHIPFILDLIFAERRQRAFQRQPTFLQASTDLRQGCPRCTHHTHPHTLTHMQYTSGQTHLQPLSCMCVFVCRYVSKKTFHNAEVVQYIGETNH